MIKFLISTIIAAAASAIAMAAPSQTLTWDDVERGELPAALEEVLNACIREDMLDRGNGTPCLTLTGQFQPDAPHANGDWFAMSVLNSFWTAYWNRRLNSAYRAMQVTYKAGGNLQPLLDQLRDTQRRWIAWRDAKCAFDGAYEQNTSRWAKLKPGACRAHMTAVRALELELMAKVISY